MADHLSRRDAMLRLSSALVAAGGAGMIGSQCVPQEAPAADIGRSAYDVAPTELHRLIEAHRLAADAWFDAAHAADYRPQHRPPNHEDLQAEATAASAAEMAALMAIVSYQPTTLDELRSIVGYMTAGPRGPWFASTPEPEEIAALFGAIMAGRAGA